MAKRKPLVFIAGEIVESKSSDTVDGNNITVTASGSTTERLLKDRFNDFINVKDYGAKGNGITDDTAAFQAAVSVAEQKNSVIYVPYGVYNISEPVEGEFISFGHPIITGNGSVTFLLDLFDDLVHKTKNVNETITGDKTFTGKTTFNGATANKSTETHSGAETHTGPETHEGNETHGKATGTVLTYHGTEVHDGPETHSGTEGHTGNETHAGTETHTGNETHKGTEVHEGSETHGKANGTTLTYHGTEIHDGQETHSGTEIHNGPVTFNNTFTLTGDALLSLLLSILAPENNGFVAPNTINGKLRVDPNEFIATNGGLNISSSNNINKLKVDFSNANAALLASITPYLIQENGGLSINPTTNKLQADAPVIEIENVVWDYGDQPVNGAKTFTQGPYGTTINLTNNTVNLAQGQVFTKTITANTTFVFSGLPNNATATFNLILTNGGAFTIIWPNSVKWAEGEAPDLVTTGIDVLTFVTPNGGTTWYGTLAIGGAA